MSFLLRNNRTRHDANISLNTSMLRSFAPKRTIPRAKLELPSRSDGKTQTQLQTVQKRQTSLFQNDSSHVSQSVISMDEVMADLRVLEEQQIESQYKVEGARVAKSRGLQQQNELEVKLDQLKYRNGQQRAELQRFHKLLADGQRLLQSTRSEAERASESLRNFDQNVKELLELRRACLSIQLKKDHLIHKLRSAVSNLYQVINTEEKQFVDVSNENKNIRVREARLRKTTHSLVVKQQKTSEDVASTRSEAIKYEEQLDRGLSVEASIKQTFENSLHTFKSEREQHEKNIIDLQSNLKQCQGFLVSLSSKKSEIIGTINQVKESFQDLSEKCIDIQKNECHHVSISSYDPECAPVLDLLQIHNSLHAAVKSAKDAKEEIARREVILEGRNSLILQLRAELEETNTTSAVLRTFVEENCDNQAKREISYSKVLLELKDLKAEVEEKHCVIQRCRSQQDMELNQAKEYLYTLREKSASRKTGLCNATDELYQLEAEIRHHGERYSKTKVLDDRKLKSLGKELDDLIKMSETRKSDALELSRCDLAEDGKVRKCIHERTIDQIEQGIKQICEEHPILQKVVVSFDPQQNFVQQESSAFKLVNEFCIQQAESAMKVKVQEGAHRQKVQRIEIDMNERPESKFQLLLQEHKQHHFEKQMITQSSHEQLSGNFHPTSTLSAAKPRSLLDMFSKASLDTNIDLTPCAKNRRKHGGKKAKTKAEFGDNEKKVRCGGKPRRDKHRSRERKVEIRSSQTNSGGKQFASASSSVLNFQDDNFASSSSVNMQNSYVSNIEFRAKDKMTDDQQWPVHGQENAPKRSRKFEEQGKKTCSQPVDLASFNMQTRKRLTKSSDLFPDSKNTYSSIVKPTGVSLPLTNVQGPMYGKEWKLENEKRSTNLDNDEINILQPVRAINYLRRDTPSAINHGFDIQDNSKLQVLRLNRKKRRSAISETDEMKGLTTGDELGLHPGCKNESIRRSQSRDDDCNHETRQSLEKLKTPESRVEGRKVFKTADYRSRISDLQMRNNYEKSPEECRNIPVPKQAVNYTSTYEGTYQSMNPPAKRSYRLNGAQKPDSCLKVSVGNPVPRENKIALNRKRSKLESIGEDAAYCFL